MCFGRIAGTGNPCFPYKNASRKSYYVKAVWCSGCGSCSEIYWQHGSTVFGNVRGGKRIVIPTFGLRLKCACALFLVCFAMFCTPVVVTHSVNAATGLLLMCVCALFPLCFATQARLWRKSSARAEFFNFGGLFFPLEIPFKNA